MKAWKIVGPSDLQFVETKSKREPGQIRVKISTCALSETDLASFKGSNRRSDIIPSHSAVGYVSEADEGSEFKMGMKVVLSPFINNAIDKNNIIQRKISIMGVDIDGFLCDFVNMPAENVYLVPEGIKAESAVFIDYIALANQVLENFDFQKGDFLLIIGASTFGIILSQLALYYQLVPILVDMYDDRLKYAEELGIYYTINSRKEDIGTLLNEITGGRMVDFAAFEPRELPFSIAYDYIKGGGMIVVSGYNNFVMEFDADIEKIFAKQITVKGVNNGIDEISSAINLVANNVVDTSLLIDETFDFDDAPEAFKHCHGKNGGETTNTKSYGKVLIKSKNL